MNLWILSWAYVRHNAPNLLLNVMLLALAVATATVLLLLSQQLESRLKRDAEGIDLVIGATGSPLQLILSSVYHVDVPTGNIPLAEADWLDGHPLVRETVPIALGDNYHGFRIVGSDSSYIDLYGGEYVAGGPWQETMQAVLGAEVAVATGLVPGDRFVGIHGITGGATEGHPHEETPYAVSGILAPTGTVLDRLIIAPLESVWHVHAPHQPDTSAGTSHGHHHDHHHADSGEAHHHHHREVTAVLVRYRSPLAAVSLPRQINTRPALQAASPAAETTRLLAMLGVGFDAIRALGWILLAAAGLGIFLALYGFARQHRYDHALLRSLGASRGQVFLHILLQSLIVAAAGVALGLLAGHLAADLVGQAFGPTRQFAFTGRIFLVQELWIAGLALSVAALAALPPAIQASRRDVAAVLTREGG
ncbi:MAG: FtsX-like permease family protein [Ectothiorhodospiraceae bacterium]|nr:FtsX-like permease family protein [Ectothiorhodospiraceae bacterium]